MYWDSGLSSVLSLRSWLRGWWKSGNELVAFLAITQHLATHFSSDGTPHTVKYWSVQNKQKNSEKRLPTCSINYWGKPWQSCSDTVVHPFIPFYHFGDAFFCSCCQHFYNALTSRAVLGPAGFLEYVLDLPSLLAFGAFPAGPKTNNGILGIAPKALTIFTTH